MPTKVKIQPKHHFVSSQDDKKWRRAITKTVLLRITGLQFKTFTSRFRISAEGKQSAMCPSLHLSLPIHKMQLGKRDTTQNISCSVVSRFPLHFLLYLGNLDYFLDSVPYVQNIQVGTCTHTKTYTATYPPFQCTPSDWSILNIINLCGKKS